MKFQELQRKIEEDTHPIAENSRVTTALASCYMDHEQMLKRRVENAVLRVFATFDKHMRLLFDHNHLTYIPFPPMMPFARAAMSADPFTSSSTATAAGTSEVLTRDSSTHPLLFILPDPPLLYSIPWMMLPYPLEILYTPSDYIYTLMDVYVFIFDGCLCF
ncbi:hypothetical protein M9H77_09412 [Catharanthus roseus]|uniref:Uncharacterized protein n=1 Tax=Catharanthus roseus TaxID=4058 RepID=A0ACC0C0U7_CATRO|nr:hypothetical protein M9H77_09412 [Catharanthus roseus]